MHVEWAIHHHHFMCSSTITLYLHENDGCHLWHLVLLTIMKSCWDEGCGNMDRFFLTSVWRLFYHHLKWYLHKHKYLMLHNSELDKILLQILNFVEQFLCSALHYTLMIDVICYFMSVVSFLYYDYYCLKRGPSWNQQLTNQSGWSPEHPLYYFYNEINGGWLK